MDKDFIVFNSSFMIIFMKLREVPIAHYKDIGLIITTTGLGVGSNVDAGSGCGNTASYFARVSCNVTSYEVKPDF